MLLQKKENEVRKLPRHVSHVNSKMVKHDARKTVFIRVGAERDAIIPLKLRTANNAGRCAASYVINALVANACVLACVLRTPASVDGKREIVFKRRAVFCQPLRLDHVRENTFV